MKCKKNTFSNLNNDSNIQKQSSIENEEHESFVNTKENEGVRVSSSVHHQVGESPQLRQSREENKGKLDSVLNKKNERSHDIPSVPNINARHDASASTPNPSPSEAEVRDQESGYNWNQLDQKMS